jgi:hypothetical protein
MKRLLLLAIAAFAISAKGALDLAPRPTEFEGEGIKYTRLSFKDDKQDVIYVPPQNWSYRGSSAQLRLSPPPNFSQAEAVVEVVPLAAPQPLNEKGIELVRLQFASTVPPGAQAAKMLSEEPSPVMINGNIASYEITGTCQIYGETFVRSVLFANLGETQLRFRLTALKKDFDALHRQFRASLVSWQWVEASPTTVAQDAATQTVAAPRQ